ncbi:MAG: helix-turn-helix transcriptional regulator [Clostridia bacterium]
MISYEAFWKTMKKQGITTYYLRNKGEDYNLSGSTIQRIKANLSISTNTIDTLCKMLHCKVEDIITYVE